jgi:hypothetical protein
VATWWIWRPLQELSEAVLVATKGLQCQFGGHHGDAKSGFGSHCRPPGGSGGHHRGCQTVLTANAVAATVGCQASLNFLKRYFIFLYVVRQPPHLKKMSMCLAIF